MMQQAKPLVTINIVTRNRREALARAIESVHAQTYQPIEVVVVDNESSDGTPAEVANQWPDIRLIRLHRNVGCQPGRNIGMKNSRGKYIFNLDDDGTLDPCAIEHMVNRFESEDDVAVVSAAIAPMSPDRAHLVKQRRLECARYLGNFTGGAAGIRQSVLAETGYFPEYPRGHAEADLALRILDKRFEIVYLPDMVMYHEVSEIERNKNVVRYYTVWHRLETRFRLEPWSRCIPNSVWKVLLDLRASLGNGTLPGFVGGVIRFLYELPRILMARTPVSRWAVQKANFLSYNYITDGSESRRFRKFSFWQAFYGRMLGRHKRVRPATPAPSSEDSIAP